jgi:hypothetical protein
MAKAPADLKSLARAHTAMAVNVLYGVARSAKAPPSARVAAAACLLDRGWGKAPQEHTYHRTWRIELAAPLTLRAGEATEEVFVDAAEDVLRLIVRLAHADARHNIDQLAQHDFVECRAVIILRQPACRPPVPPEVLRNSSVLHG